MSEKPRCMCGSKNWQQGGAHLGPGFQFSDFFCGDCRRVAQEIGREGYYVFLIFREEHAELAMAYANGPLQIMSRVYKKEWEAIKETCTQQETDKFLRQIGLDPTKGCKYDPALDENGEPVQVPMLDRKGEPCFYSDGRPMTDMVFEYQDNDGVRLDVDQEVLKKGLRAAFDKYHRFPGELLTPPLPPQLPSELDAYLLVTEYHSELVASSHPELGDRTSKINLHLSTTKEWVLVYHEESNALPIPPDPRRVAHDAFFAEVFAEVQERTSLTFEPDVIPSQYENRVAEPWYTWTMLRGNVPVKFLVGPRHRVHSITISTEDPILKTEALKFLTDKDGVTYDADGGWKSSKSVAKEITVHAWGKEKLVEYLIAALHTALDTACVVTGEGAEAVLKWRASE